MSLRERRSVEGLFSCTEIGEDGHERHLPGVASLKVSALIETDLLVQRVYSLSNVVLQGSLAQWASRPRFLGLCWLRRLMGLVVGSPGLKHPLISP